VRRLSDEIPRTGAFSRIEIKYAPLDLGPRIPGIRGLAMAG
jgi:hypothetical protein